MTESRPCHKLKGIQAFRGFAILLIVMSHVVGRGFAFGGESGVCFFFVMSVFVLSMANDEKLRTGKIQTMRFVFHQLRKFYPLLALSLSFFVFAYWHAGYPVDYGKLLTNLLLIQTWFCSRHLVFSYVGSSWFLCDILVFYLFFKPLNRCIIGKSVKSLVLTWVAVVVIYAPFVFLIPSERFNYTLYSFPLFRLIDCCLGIALYRFVMSGEGERLSEQMDKKAYGWQSLILVVLLAFCLAFFAYRDVLPVNFRGVSFFWPFAFLFIISLMVIERSRPRFFSLPLVKIFTFLGDISMEMFLTHEIVIYVLNVVVAHYGLCRVHPLVLYAFYIVAMILFAWLARLGLSRLLVIRVRI